MLKCEIGENIDNKMIVQGSTMNIADDVLNIIKYLYNTFRQRNPVQAEMFRKALLIVLQNPESSIWDGSGRSTSIDLSAFQGGKK